MIHAIVVIYNVFCADSLTCQRLKQQTYAGFDVIVFDNSDKDYGNRTYCEAAGWVYLGGNGNQGLSIAYNTAIGYLQDREETGYLCLLDDDTAIPEDFFENVQEQLQQNKEADILLPILMQRNKIISPCRLSARHRYFASIEECLQEEPEKLQAFNSGMMTALWLYQDYRYDERIFLDGLDHAFLRDMKRKGKSIKVIPVQCGHHFSGGEKGTFEGALRRFQIYVKDSRILYEENWLKYCYIVGKRALHLTVQFHKLQFIQYFFFS